MGNYCYSNIILFLIMHLPTLYLTINAVKGERGMLFRKDMSGYPLGTFFIAVFFPLKFVFKPYGCSWATLPMGTCLLPAVLAGPR